MCLHGQFVSMGLLFFLVCNKLKKCGVVCLHVWFVAMSFKNGYIVHQSGKVMFAWLICTIKIIISIYRASKRFWCVCMVG